MTGVPAGEAENGERKTPRQKETEKRTGRAGTAAARAPRGGQRPPCPARAIHLEHCPAFFEGIRTGRTRGSTEQARFHEASDTAPAFQVLAGQA